MIIKVGKEEGRLWWGEMKDSEKGVGSVNCRYYERISY